MFLLPNGVKLIKKTAVLFALTAITSLNAYSKSTILKCVTNDGDKHLAEVVYKPEDAIVHFYSVNKNKHISLPILGGYWDEKLLKSPYANKSYVFNPVKNIFTEVATTTHSDYNLPLVRWARVYECE